MSTKESGHTGYLIADDDEKPSVTMKPGMRFEVRAVSVVDAKLQESKKIAARLCGGSSTCLALIDIEPPFKEKINP